MKKISPVWFSDKTLFLPRGLEIARPFRFSSNVYLIDKIYVIALIYEYKEAFCMLIIYPLLPR